MGFHKVYTYTKGVPKENICILDGYTVKFHREYMYTKGVPTKKVCLVNWFPQIMYN